jgi:hypothetical protein
MMRRSLLALALAGSVFMTACGSGNPVASTPSPTPTAAPTAGPVSLQLLGSAGLAGVDVLLSDSSGATQAVTKTDALGQAAFVVQPGANVMLTVISQDPEKYGRIHLETYTDLGPGDKIQTYPVVPDIPPDSQAAIVVDFGDRPPEGTEFYSLSTHCAGQLIYARYERLQGYVLNIPNSCSLGPGNTLDVTVTALNGDYLTLGYSQHAGLTIAPNAKTTVTFPDGWKTDLTPFALTYKNVPASFTQLNTIVAPLTAYGSNASGFGPTYNVAAGDGDTKTLLYVKPLAQRLAYEILLTENRTGTSNQPHGAQILYADVAAGIPTSATVDLATVLPATVTDMRKTDGDTFRPGVAWATSGSLAGLYIGNISFNWKRGTSYVYWSMYFPPTASSPMKVPEIPDALAYARPTGDDGTFLGGISFAGNSTIAGYHEYLKGVNTGLPAGDVTSVLTARVP